MNTRPPDAVYNLTRRALLNDKLTVSDCASQPLKMLSLVVSGLGLDSESALWLYPLHAAPGLPRVFPFDLLYLDKDYRVLETAEIAPGVEFPSYRADVASALVVPQHTLSSTGTKKGDRLMICSEKELQALLAKTGDSGRADNVVVSPVPSVAASPAERLSPVAQNSVPALAKPPVPAQPSNQPNQAEMRRFLFERMDQTKLEDSQPHPERTQAHAQASGPDPNPSRIVAAQKAATPDNPEFRASVPQRAAGSRPSRSTTSFATSSLPQWHVSAPTAIASASSSIRLPISATPQTETFRVPGSSPATGANQDDPRAFDLAATQVSSSSTASNSPLRDDSMEIWSSTEPAKEAIGVSAKQKEAEAPSLISDQENGGPLNSSTAIKTRDLRAVQLPLHRSPSATPKVPSRAATLQPRLDPKTSERWSTDRGTDEKEDTRKTLRSKLREWLNPVRTPSDRRRSERRYVPGMFAHYFTGGAPKPHQVADISLTGFYLLTEDRWMTGTVIQMTMQKPSRRGGKQSITVLSRVVRRGSDGVGAEFVMPESINSYTQDIQPSQATDRAALARFL